MQGPSYQALLLGPIGFFCLAIFCYADGQASQSSSDSLSRYHRIAYHLTKGKEQELRQFALIALDQLAEAYSAEAELARREFRGTTSDSAKNRGWAVSVKRYSDYLHRVSDALIAARAPVTMSVDELAPVLLKVGDYRLMLSHPRDGQQSAFEQAVLTKFCQHNLCHQLLAGQTVPSAALAAIRASLLTWEFSSDAISCSAADLHLHFGAGEAISTVKRLCQQLFTELEALSIEFKQQREQGVVIDWAQLSIEAVDQQGLHLIHLNSTADAALLELPLLASMPALMQAISDWFAEVDRQQKPLHLDLQASDYRWPVL
ncbi:hypothetical protein H2508_00870 [Parahaliea sp. F7430]|uniref:Uncharacterized protein n=1 Tax=Sediminihaliea albiluteola TaxID=2758564 RepID=A0A7W2TTG6_9GAMM|nr:hypothetical protein [Sediminihaliea albiluteola]MBA6411672.1 hypothetical protein [Sediminihaliea albiluteola]